MEHRRPAVGFRCSEVKVFWEVQVFRGLGRPWVGPRHVPRDTTITTRPRFTASRLGYQHCCGAVVLKPQMYEAATEFGDKNTFTSPPQIQKKTKPKAFTEGAI